MALIDNLVSWWTLDETSGTRADSHGNNDLSDSGSTGYAAGKKSNAADFEAGSRTRLKITDAAQTGLDITGDMSLEFWLQREADNTQWMPIVGKTGTANNFSFFYMHQNGATKQFILAHSSNGAALTYKYLAFVMTAGTWYHVVFVFDASAGELYVYVNGTAQTTQTGLPTSIYSGSSDFQIGDNYPDSNNCWDGLIDEAAIWDRVLTTDEVADLYNGGDGVTYSEIGSTNVTVTPTTLALTSALVSPTVSTVQNITVTPSVLALTSATVAPAVVTETTIAPNVIALTSALLSPSVTAGGDVTISASVLAVTSALVSPTIAAESNITVAANVLALTGAIIAPTVSVVSSQTVTPSVLSLIIGLGTPIIHADAWSRVGRNSTGTWTRSSRNST